MRYSSQAKKTLDKIKRGCRNMTGSEDRYYRNDENFRVGLTQRSDKGEIRGKIYLQTVTGERSISNFIIDEKGVISNGPVHLKGLTHAKIR